MSFLRNAAKFLIVSGFVLFTGSISASAASLAAVSTDVLNVRSEASTNSEVVSKLLEGEIVEIVGLEGEWFVISANDSKAYVLSEYVTISQASAVVNSDGVNVRSGASTENRIVGNLSSGDNITVTGQSGEFYAISYDGGTAFVHKDFVVGNYLEYLATVSGESTAYQPASSSSSSASASSEEVYAVVTSDSGVYIRSDKSTSSSILGAIPANDATDVLELGSEWHKISYNGVSGYVKAEYLEIKTGTKPASTSSNTSLAQSIISYAKQFIGTPYSYGGTSLKSGVDCSGFTYSVFKNFGISLSRSSSEQVNNGTKISSKSDLQAGDLVFFTTNGSGTVSHVGIYIGGGQFIHSSSGSAYSVTISGLNDSYYANRFVSGARVI